MISVYDAHAGLERVSVLILLIDDTLGYYNRERDTEQYLHPSIHTQEAKELLGRITDDLNSLYQQMGEQMLCAEEAQGEL